MGIIKKKEKKLKYQRKFIASGYEGITFHAVWDKKNPNAVGIMLSGEHILSKKLPDRMICEMEEVHKDYLKKGSYLFIPTASSKYDVFNTNYGRKQLSGIEIENLKSKENMVVIKDNLERCYLLNTDNNKHSDFYDKIERIPGYRQFIVSKNKKEGLLGYSFHYGLTQMLPLKKGKLQCITKSGMLIRREKGCVEGYKLRRLSSEAFEGKDRVFRGEKLEWQDEIEIGRLKNIGTGKWGLINLYKPDKSAYKNTCIYESIGKFQNIDIYHWIAKAKLNGKYGYINTDGTEYIPCIFDEISDFDEKKTAKAKFNGEEFVLEKNKIIVSPKFLSTHKISPSKNVEVLCKNDFEEIKDI
jgi:hypothetical protein